MKTKLQDWQKMSIIEMKKKGFSSRYIADTLGIASKTTVNDYWNKVKQQDVEQPEVAKPKILLLDLETAAATAMTFGRWNVNLSQSNIVDEGGWILCASYKWLGDDQQTTLFLTPEEIYEQDDFRIVAELFDVLKEATAIVAHNGKKFDHKVLQTRSIANGLGPLPSVKVIDTLQIAKSKLKLPSNKLDSIGEYFNLGRKIETEGISLWKKVQEGNKSAMARMVEYCEQDLNLLEAVYLKLRSLGNAGSGYNAGLEYNDNHVHCPTCGSTNVKPTGRVVNTSLSTFYEVQCADCQSVHRTRKALTTKGQRKNLLQSL